MKYVKMLGLLAVATAALMAIAGTASATQLTDANSEVITPLIEAKTEAFEGKPHASLTGPLGIKVECESTVKGAVEKHGATSTVFGKLATLSFTNCTNGYTVTVLEVGGNPPTGPLGALEVHSTEGKNGTVTSTGTTVTIVTPLGFNCEYTTGPETDVGVLTSSKNTGKVTATLDIRNAVIPRTGHSPLCGTTGTWNGNYTVTSPDYLDVD